MILTRETGWKGGFLGLRNSAARGQLWDPDHSAWRGPLGLDTTGTRVGKEGSDLGLGATVMAHQVWDGSPVGVPSTGQPGPARRKQSWHKLRHLQIQAPSFGRAIWALSQPCFPWRVSSPWAKEHAHRELPSPQTTV